MGDGVPADGTPTSVSVKVRSRRCAKHLRRPLWAGALERQFMRYDGRVPQFAEWSKVGLVVTQCTERPLGLAVAMPSRTGPLAVFQVNSKKAIWVPSGAHEKSPAA